MANQKKIKQRYPIQDFSKGTITDKSVGKGLLQATNAILNPGGDFEKRKGTELLTSTGISVRPNDDVYGVYWYAYDSDNNCYYLGYAFESTKGALDTIIGIDCGTGTAAIAAAEAYYDAWVAASVAGSYDSSYTCVYANDCGGGG